METLLDTVWDVTCSDKDHCDRVATGQEMVRKKINQGQGEVPEFYFESGKIDTLKKSQGKLK